MIGKDANVIMRWDMKRELLKEKWESLKKKQTLAT